MACLKRFLDGQDPDYEDSAPNEAKRLRLLEQNAKADVSHKVSSIIEREFTKELTNKEKETLKIQERLHQAQKTLHLLRYAIVRNYYMKNEQSQQGSQQTRIHPAVKKLIGKQPQHHPFWGQLEQRPSKYRQVNTSVPSTACSSPKTELVGPESPGDTFPVKTCSSTEPTTSDAVPSEAKVTKVPRYIPPKPDSSKIQPQIGLSRGLRHKVKKRLVIGNISKWIPVDAREDSASHKWMIYVRGPREAPDVSGFISKVRFFLHPSFRPNDVVEVTSPPFHLSRRGWGEFPVRVQVHFSHPLNKPVDVLHHLKLDSSYTGLQRLGAETVVDIWLYTIPTSLNCAPEVDGRSEKKECVSISSPGNSEPPPGHTTGRDSRGDAGDVQLEGHVTVAESSSLSLRQGGYSLKNENVCIKEESGIESCGSSDVSEPPVCKSDSNMGEEESSSRIVVSNFDFNTGVKEEPECSDQEIDCISEETSEHIDVLDFNVGNVKQEIQVSEREKNDSEPFDDGKPEFVSTMFDHDYFSSGWPPRVVKKEVVEDIVDENTSSLSHGNDDGMPLAINNEFKDYTVNSFQETEINDMQSNVSGADLTDSPESKLNGHAELCTGNASNHVVSQMATNQPNVVATLHDDAQKVEVARKATTLVKCMNASGNIFYITLATSLGKLDQDAGQPVKRDVSATSFLQQQVTRTGSETVMAPCITATTAPLSSATNVSQSSSVALSDSSFLSSSIANLVKLPGIPVNRATQNVVNISTQESKTVASSLVSQLEGAKCFSNVKNLQGTGNNIKCTSTGKGLLNIVQGGPSVYGSTKKVVLVTPASSVSSVIAKQAQQTLLANGIPALSLSSGVQPKQNQTVLLLRDGQYYIVKQPQETSSSVKPVVAFPEKHSVGRTPQQCGVVFKLPAAGSTGIQNTSPRLDTLSAGAAAFHAKPGCSLLKKKVGHAPSPPPLCPITRPLQATGPGKQRAGEDAKLPVVPVIKKVDRKMIVLNRTHGPITATTVLRASHHEEKLKAAVDACKFPSQALCVRWLLRHLPLVSDNVSDHNFRMVHPYAAPSHEAFLQWNIGKQRSAEWMRAKSVQKYLVKLGYSEDSVWSTRAIVMWGRLHGYTPVARCGNSTGLKMSASSCAVSEKSENRSTYSEPVQIMEWLETNGNSSLCADDDMEIDVISLNLPLRTVKKEEDADACGSREPSRVELMDHEHALKTDCAFVREKVRELGFKMAAEEIAPGVTYCAAERLMLEAMKCLAEDLLRRALCKAWMRNSNRPPETVLAADVIDALLGREEFDIFTNFGLGVQVADTG